MEDVMELFLLLQGWHDNINYREAIMFDILQKGASLPKTKHCLPSLR